MKPGQPPLMGKIVVPELKLFLGATDDGGTGKAGSDAALGLLSSDADFYRDRNQYSGIIFKAKAKWCNLAIGVGTGNHLYRNVNT